ncbi:MAG: cytochrome c biogenesis protein CcdA [Spirochaetaceae bacterium]|jgi:cytochrome c-type biogenesis protein|nr:cytochrome c biogenesis protein CcdA [Spirochaetaceae bacterium]
METNVTVIAAFAAGLLSFLSPCVLPLFGSYLAFISGGTVSSSTQAPGVFFSARNFNAVLSALFFVLGFSVVFSALGILLYGFFLFLSGWNAVINFLSGLIVVVLGLNIIFGFIPFLKYDDSEKRCETCLPENSPGFNYAKAASRRGGTSKKQRGFLAAFLMGIAFGAGWTPCVSAFLGSVLLMASQSSTMGYAALCLVFYAAGLGIPFLIASFFWAGLMEKAARYRRFLPVVKYISGIFLILTGILMLLGRMPALNALLQSAMAWKAKF